MAPCGSNRSRSRLRGDVPLISSKPVSGQPVNSDRSLDTRAFIITNPENAANFCIGRDSGRTSVSTLNTSAIQPAHKVESAGFGEDRARAQAGAGRAGLWNQSVDIGACRAPDRTGMRRGISPGPRLAHLAVLGMEFPAPRRPGAGAGRSEDPAVGTEALAGD
jgi:hypothetical protein